MLLSHPRIVPLVGAFGTIGIRRTLPPLLFRCWRWCSKKEEGGNVEMVKKRRQLADSVLDVDAVLVTTTSQIDSRKTRRTNLNWKKTGEEGEGSGGGGEGKREEQR